MMTIKFAKYAFKDILELLNYSGINEITITMEDNELKIVIPTSQLKVNPTTFPVQSANQPITYQNGVIHVFDSTQPIYKLTE